MQWRIYHSTHEYRLGISSIRSPKWEEKKTFFFSLRMKKQKFQFLNNITQPERERLIWAAVTCKISLIITIPPVKWKTKVQTEIIAWSLCRICFDSFSVFFVLKCRCWIQWILKHFHFGGFTVSAMKISPKEKKNC